MIFTCNKKASKSHDQSVLDMLFGSGATSKRWCVIRQIQGVANQEYNNITTRHSFCSFGKTLTISDDERSVSFQATSAQRRYPGILHATCFTFLRILLISISTGGGEFGLYQTWKSAKVGNVNSTRLEDGYYGGFYENIPYQRSRQMGKGEETKINIKPNELDRKTDVKEEEDVPII